jgi:hypothetical protein
MTGKTTCAGGVVDCAADSAKDDGTTCTTGSCTRGECRENVTVSSESNISTTAISTGRVCAESVAYAVTALTATTATLSSEPVAGCLEPGDEVMLINMQGTPTTTPNIGVFELLHVQTVVGDVVTFTTSKAKFYGSADNSDADIGAAPGQQRVVLQRVPTFGKLTIANGSTLTASAWDGSTGGIVAVRANSFTIDGTVSARGLGYRAGRWSRDDGACAVSVHTEQGESIGGVGMASTAANGGGGGGIGEGTQSYNSDAPVNGSAGHGTAGAAGGNFKGRAEALPGGTYGVADGSRITLGSGAGGNLTCAIGTFEPHLITVSEGHGGGAIALFGGSITVSATGALTANGTLVRSTASSGGYILLRGTAIDFSTGSVAALGPTATNVLPDNNPETPVTNVGGDGRIAVQYVTSVNGTSTPAAHTAQIAMP